MTYLSALIALRELAEGLKIHYWAEQFDIRPEVLKKELYPRRYRHIRRTTHEYERQRIIALAEFLKSKNQ